MQKELLELELKYGPYEVDLPNDDDAQPLPPSAMSKKHLSEEEVAPVIVESNEKN